MVHIWGPVLSPTKMTNDRIKRVVAIRPALDVKEVSRLRAAIQTGPGYYLKGLIIRVRQRSRSLFKSLRMSG